VSLPKPEPGLLIRYSYLWLWEHQEGREEGVKDRPCAIILALRDVEGDTKTLVVPVTHSPPKRGDDALELPPTLKRHLGLDAERSWVVVSEGNFFTWPGPDLRRVGDRDDSSVAYGILPPKFFAELKRRWLAFEAEHGSRRVPRTE
jgi:hypothetical protein